MYKLIRLILITSVFAGNVSLANIMSLTPGLSAEGTITYDEVSSVVIDTQQSDSFALGAESSSVNNGLVNGMNPITGSLVSSLSFNSDLSAQNSDIDFEYVSYFFDLTLSNNLVSDAVEYVFNFDFFHQVEATANLAQGDDAFVDSSISLFDQNNVELVFSSISSDLNNGPFSLSDNLQFSTTLAAGESATFSGLFEANLFSFGESSFNVLSQGNVSLMAANILSTDIPEPGAASLALLSCALMLTMRRHPKSR